MMNDFERQLDAIRVELYEKTRTMNSAQAVQAINEEGIKLARKYGITIAKSEDSKPNTTEKAQ